MSSASETGFGARLENAQTLKSYMQGFPNFSPPRAEDSLEEFGKLVTSCANANTDIASLTQSYTLAVKNRQNAFKGTEDDSISKLLSPISKYVQAMFGKDSREYSSIANIISKLRSTKIEKAPKNPDEEFKESISRSEMSYGSQLQNFKDLVASLEQFKDFKPNNKLIQIPNLKKRVEEITVFNQQVIATTLPLRQKREERKELFEDLHNRSQRIKSYVSASYGNKSSEYKAISKLRI